eukprot:9232192-Ditylum_brightwellii.AAC.1
MPHQTEHMHGSTRVPSTPSQIPHLNQFHQQTHPRHNANMPHVIPPMENMPPPNIPAMYIPTPKGWTKIYPHHQQQPHVITSCHGIKLCNDIQGKYIQAVQQVSTMEIIANAVINKETGESQEYKHLIKGKDKSIWYTSCSNGFSRLTQGVGNCIKKGTNTVLFIHKKDMPHDKRPTYARFVVDIRPQKAETHQTCVTVG